MLTLIDSNRTRTTSNRHERDLIAGLRRGNDASYEQLVCEHGGAMLAVARRYLRSEDDARDAVQEAMLSAFRGIASFSADAKLSTWLHRIVVNCALMRLRSRRRRPEEAIEDALPGFNEHGGFAEQGGFAPGLTDWEASAPETLIDRRRMRQIVRRCIDRLPESYRALLLARDIEERETDEVAELLGLTVSAVKSRLHRARQALRELLAAELGMGAAPREHAVG